MLLSWSLLTQDKMLKILEIAKIMLLSWSHWHRPNSLKINMLPKSCSCLGRFDISQVAQNHLKLSKSCSCLGHFWHKPSCFKSKIMEILALVFVSLDTSQVAQIT
jgi:hypothetical protein